MTDTERNRPDELWDESDVAAFLRVSERTVKRRVKEDGLPSFMIGGVRRFDPAEVRDWLETQRVA